jgi:ribosomal protein S18 acetylase RimI-like enzyme
MGPSTDYTFTIEPLHLIFSEVEPHWRDHYAAMKARLEGEGVKVAEYDPRVDEYFRSSKDGWLKTFTARHKGKLVGYATIYVTHDMHNRELIATEDFIYVTPAHRNGTGRKLTKFVLENLKRLGVKRFHVTAITDTRAADLWKRLGFKDTARHMIYNFEAANV